MNVIASLLNYSKHFYFLNVKTFHSSQFKVRVVIYEIYVFADYRNSKELDET